MMGRKREKEFFEEAMDKMFQAVGLPGWDREFTKEHEWYQKYSWTKPEWEEYRRWFLATARKKLRWSKKTAEKEFGWFFLMYGWTTREENNEQKQ